MPNGSLDLMATAPHDLSCDPSYALQNDVKKESKGFEN
jgi:hypothetical protein